MVRLKYCRLALFNTGISGRPSQNKPGIHFCVSKSASWTNTADRAFYGRTALFDKDTGTHKIRFLILLLHSPQTGLNFRAQALANSSARGNENWNWNAKRLHLISAGGKLCYGLSNKQSSRIIRQICDNFS
ncbi:hypothetical protein TNCV_993841 [Trichonephila clavipes]|nr:hypothetical protein TNCV_993841 [Trichonephila clavipes]